MVDNTTLNPGTGGDVIASNDISGVKYPRNKVVFGAAGSASDVSPANPLPVYGPDVIATGTITTTDIAIAAPAGAGAFVTGTSTAGSYVFVLCGGGDTAWNIQITGLTSGNLYFEGSLDSTNGIDGQWIAINGRQTGVVNTVLANNASANGMYRGNTSGLKYFRVRSAGTLTGTPAIVIRISDGQGATFLNASIPAGTNSIGTVVIGAGSAAIGSLTAGTALIGKVGLDQTTPGTTNAVAISTLNATAVATGNGVVGTGVLRVAVASDNTAFAIKLDQTTPGTTNAIALSTLGSVAVATGNGVVGTGVLRVAVASDNTAFAIKVDQTTPGTTNAVALSTIGATAAATGNGVVSAGVLRVAIASDNTAFSVNTVPPTLTKATQGATGFSTQDLKDAGRAIVNAATAIAGVAGVTTEALVTFNVSRDGAATSALTTIPVTSTKRWRITGMVVVGIATTAAVFSARVSLRMNPSGAATATSPIIATAGIAAPAAVAQTGDIQTLMFPDGIEVSGTMQIGVTQVAFSVNGTLWVSLIGYEY